MMVWVPRVMTDAIPAIGARTLPASMLAATRAPTVSLPSRMRKYADDDQKQAGKLLRRVCARQRQRRPEMHVLARPRGCCDRALPGRLHAGLGARCTDGFQPERDFNQHAVASRGFGLQSLHGTVERALHRKPERDHDGQHQRAESRPADRRS